MTITDVKYGRDEELEELADKLLNASVRENTRGTQRDIEKMSYERGFITEDELKHYDPANDWDTHDQPSVWLVDALEITYLMPTRRTLMRHVEDDDDWGSTQEDIPLLGVNEGPRKVCTKCKRSKGPDCFSHHPNTKDNKQSQCRACRR